jgi:hypothetical protein
MEKSGLAHPPQFTGPLVVSLKQKLGITDSFDMKRLMLLAALLTIASGCLRPMTQRLDLVNEQLAATNAKLDDMSRKLDETNQKLSTVEKATRLFVPGAGKKE